MTEQVPARQPDIEESPIRSFEEFREHGLLWLVNRVVFHPRGYALAFVMSDAVGMEEEVVGWKMIGDGTEPWAYEHNTEDDLFIAAEKLFESLRIAGNVKKWMEANPSVETDERP
jgi:hypothetical protein